MSTFPFCQQFDSMDCGTVCLQMVAAHHRKQYSLATLRECCYVDREGVSVRGISVATERIGLETAVFQMSYETAVSTAVALTTLPLPCMMH